MLVLRETTADWSTDFEMPAHTYFVSDNRERLYAYARAGDGAVTEFSKPYRFDTRRRRFTEIPNTFGYTREETAPIPVGVQYQVAGSANNVYTVTNESGAWSCTCPAAKWQKGECKHVRQVKPAA